MREFYDVCVYERGCLDYESEGLVGPLMVSSCLHTDVAGGDNSVELTVPYDPYGKWQALQVGNSIRVNVLMRTPPAMDDIGYVESVEVWTVSAGATKDQRKVWSKREKGSNRKTLKVGTRVYVTSNDPRYDRMKIRTGKTTGWIERAGLRYETTTTVEPTADGMEKLVPAEVRPQIFDIDRVSMADNEIVVHAMHESYRILKNLTRYKSNGDVTLKDALAGMREGCVDTLAEDWRFYTDNLGKRSGVRWVDVNPIKAMLDPEVGAMAMWQDTELFRDGHEFYLLRKAGMDRGVRIEYAKNLSGFRYEVDESDVATYIVPIGETAKGEPLYLTGDKWLVSPYADLYPEKRIYSFEAQDCKVDGKQVTTAVARARMKEQAQQLLDDGCDLPSVTLTVEVSQVDVEGAQIVEQLEPLCVYDTVHIVNPTIGMDMVARVVERVWDCVSGRVKSITIGTPGASMARSSVASWQISSVSGSKLQAGSVNGLALGEGSINEKHIQAESINAEAIRAGAVAANIIAAGGISAKLITTDKLDAERIDAGAVAAQVVAAENFKAETAKIVSAQIGSVDIDYAKIKDASLDNVFTKDGNADYYYINKLRVTSAQIMELIVGNLIFKDEETGKLYELRVGEDADGDLALFPAEVSGERIIYDEEGNPVETTDGKVVFEKAMNVGELTARTAHMIYAKISALNADILFANEAFIRNLTTGTIFADGGTLTIVAQDSKEAKTVAEGADRVATIANDAAANAQSKAEEVDNKAKKISEDLERRVRINAQGLHVGDSRNTTEVMIDTNTVNIGRVIPAASEGEQDGFEAYSQFASNYARFGNYEIRQSSGDGGLVFKLAPKGVV